MAFRAPMICTPNSEAIDQALRQPMDALRMIRAEVAAAAEGLVDPHEALREIDRVAGRVLEVR